MSFKNVTENDVLSFFMMANNNCRSCGNERIEVCEHQLPKKIKKQFDEAGVKGRYLHCPKCQEYSIFLNPEFGSF